MKNKSSSQEIERYINTIEIQLLKITKKKNQSSLVCSNVSKLPN